MLCYNIGTCIEQGNSGLSLENGIIPGVGPYDLDYCLGVCFLNTEGECVDAADNLRDREGSDIADDVCLCGGTCNNTAEVSGL